MRDLGLCLVWGFSNTILSGFGVKVMLASYNNLRNVSHLIFSGRVFIALVLHIP